MSTYEFNKYIQLLKKQDECEREYDKYIASTYSIAGLFKSSQ